MRVNKGLSKLISAYYYCLKWPLISYSSSAPRPQYLSLPNGEKVKVVNWQKTICSYYDAIKSTLWRKNLAGRALSSQQKHRNAVKKQKQHWPLQVWKSWFRHTVGGMFTDAKERQHTLMHISYTEWRVMRASHIAVAVLQQHYNCTYSCAKP